MKLSKLSIPQKSPFPLRPYIVRWTLDSSSQVISWGELKLLHENVRQLCPNRFERWMGLPPEVHICSQITYVDIPTWETLSDVEAMRVDIKAGYQFSSELEIMLTDGQLVTLRKICHRIQSDYSMYATEGRLPTEYDWSNS